MLVKPKAYGASELDGPLRAIETPTKSHLTEGGLVKFTEQRSVTVMKLTRIPPLPSPFTV